MEEMETRLRAMEAEQAATVRDAAVGALRVQSAQAALELYPLALAHGRGEFRDELERLKVLRHSTNLARPHEW
jgi:hypothetical protein